MEKGLFWSYQLWYKKLTSSIHSCFLCFFILFLPKRVSVETLATHEHYFDHLFFTSARVTYHFFKNHSTCNCDKRVFFFQTPHTQPSGADGNVCWCSVSLVVLAKLLMLAQAVLPGHVIQRSDARPTVDVRCAFWETHCLETHAGKGFKRSVETHNV